MRLEKVLLIARIINRAPGLPPLSEEEAAVLQGGDLASDTLAAQVVAEAPVRRGAEAEGLVAREGTERPPTQATRPQAEALQSGHLQQRPDHASTNGDCY